MLEKRIRSLKRRLHMMFPIKRVNRNGLEYEVDCRELIDYSIFLGTWEQDTFDFLHRYVKPGFVTLEIGANIGAHTLLIAKQSGADGFVHAVEPTEFARTKLLKNLSLNPDIEKRVHVHNTLISDTVADNAQLEIRSSWPAKAKMTWKPKETVSSPVTTIDRLVADEKLSSVDLIKIDIDGYDLRALRGATKTIEKFKPLIFVELCEWALRENGNSVSEVVTHLSSLGYNGYDANGMFKLTPENALERLGNKDSINGAFFPDGKTPDMA
jgi:FkbM family methyltransferase